MARHRGGCEPLPEAAVRVAVSLKHLESGNLRGARKVMGMALEHLKEFPSRWSGVDLEDPLSRILPPSREPEAGGDPFPRLEPSPPGIRIEARRAREGG